MTTKRSLLIGSALSAALLLTGCSAGNSTAASPDTSSSGSSQHEVGNTEIAFSNAWVKSGDENSMSGVFGMLENAGSEDRTITSVESSVAGITELHEVTADGVMQKITGDVVIPAGGSYELAPGANHIMLMELTQPLLAGDDVLVTVHFDDGSSSEFLVTVKDYTGANEDYGDMANDGGGHGEH